MFTFQYPPPLSLYIHIPWCVRKCPYCDFNSHEIRNEIPEEAYLDALFADLEQEVGSVWGRTVETIFIGGGTPSVFSPDSIERLLSGVRARLNCKPGLETTLEANPGTLEKGRLAAFREAGVNRLSIGVQSFDDNCLQNIGRIHDGHIAREMVAGAHDAGFDSFNVDIMFGLPGQSVAQALDDLDTAITLEPPHLSWYQLTIEPNTLFFSRPPVLPADDELWDMQDRGLTMMMNHDYTQYEVSAYARHGHQCRHNLNYWRFGDYLGIGAGAHSKVTVAPEGTISRAWKIRHPKGYMENAATTSRIGGGSRLNPDEVVFEFLLNALRLNSGFASDEYEHATGLEFPALIRRLEAINRPECISLDSDRVRATARGRRYLNEILVEMLPDSGG